MANTYIRVYNSVKGAETSRCPAELVEGFQAPIRNPALFSNQKNCKYVNFNDFGRESGIPLLNDSDIEGEEFVFADSYDKIGLVTFDVGDDWENEPKITFRYILEMPKYIRVNFQRPIRCDFTLKPSIKFNIVGTGYDENQQQHEINFSADSDIENGAEFVDVPVLFENPDECVSFRLSFEMVFHGEENTNPNEFIAIKSVDFVADENEPFIDYFDFAGDIEVYAECDLSGRDLPASSCDFSIVTASPPSQGQSFVLISGDFIIGAFYVIEVTREANDIYLVRAESKITQMANGNTYPEQSEFSSVSEIINSVENNFPVGLVSGKNFVELPFSDLCAKTTLNVYNSRQLLAVALQSQGAFVSGFGDDCLTVSSSPDFENEAVRIYTSDKILGTVKKSNSSNFDAVAVYSGNLESPVSEAYNKNQDAKITKGVLEIAADEFFSDDMAGKILCWSGESKAEFSVEYSGENLGDVVVVEDEFGETIKGAINSISLHIGIGKIVADLSVLIPVEVE